jgi:hypothetical protein
MLMGSECCGSGVDLKNEVSKCSMHEAMLFWAASILQVNKKKLYTVLPQTQKSYRTDSVRHIQSDARVLSKSQRIS